MRTKGSADKGPREFMCQHGNCTNTAVKVVLTIRGPFGETCRFCCASHAVLWLERNLVRLDPQGHRNPPQPLTGI